MFIFKKTSIWTWSIVAVLIGVVIVSYFYDTEVSAKASQFTEKEIHWFSLIPPILAVILALILRKVILALSLSIIVGIGLIHGFNPVTLVKIAATDYLWSNFANQFGLMFIGFVFALIGMVSIINRNGGTQGVINIFKRTVKSARRASLATIGMGLAIFFDDYTNTIIVGSTMRNLTDALKVSREKLAYLVDSTAAPIAGIAIISTWIGFEVEQLQHISDLLKLDLGGYNIFFQMVPFRFYCIFTIAFVILNSVLRRDFGPMLHAEKRAIETGDTFAKEDDTTLTDDFAESRPKKGIPERWYNAVVPVALVILTLVSGILIAGTNSPAMKDQQFNILSFNTWYLSFVGIEQINNGIPTVLCIAAMFGSIVAAIMSITQKLLTPFETLKAWLHAWKIIFVVAAFIILAWTIRQVCDELGVSYFLLGATKDYISSIWIPIIVFLISAAIGFATGTSWGAMAILIPTMAPLAFNIGGLPILVFTMAAVLDGSIFGDHCSPISDTTVLSSISSGCDHVEHVKTQMPYAIVTMIVAALAGYLPAALGVPAIISYITGLAAIILILFVFGTNPRKTSE